MAEPRHVLVDTSVWIDFLTGDSAAADLLGRLRNSHRIAICGQIKQEVLQGSRDRKALATLEQELSIWDYEAEQPEDFVNAARLYAGLRWKGVTLPAADCLIAAVAKRRGWPVCATDPHFRDIPGITLVT
ncbi:MAG: PIN domain-containing protein [Acidobacteria bacterium]|nr:PIN domain-containing protein [Acidobacteriota bacterium]